MSGFREMQSGGYQSALTTPGWQVHLDSLVEAKANRERVGREALRKLAHYATDAEDYRNLAEALGLDPDLLKEKTG